MYQHIMVPLDGSELAECVFGHVIDIAECNKSKITLVRVVTPLSLATSEYAGMLSTAEFQKIEDADIAIAKKYMSEKQAYFKGKGFDVQAEVFFGNIVDSLTDFVEANGIDLIIIATHGRSGLSRWVWGSVADRILRSAKVPVLMVRPADCAVPKSA
jgi:nucleotide-binding universal stress UspA family protein